MVMYKMHVELKAKHKYSAQ